MNIFIYIALQKTVKVEPTQESMNYLTIKQFFDFLKQKEGKEIPFDLKCSQKGDYEFNIDDLIWENIFYSETVGFLPGSMLVEGDMYLFSDKVTELPSNLTVRGSLHVMHTAIRTIPADITVGVDMELSDNQIDFLPDHFVVNGDLILDNNPISVLPANLFVGGVLDISNTSVEELPDDIFVQEEIYFYNSPLANKYSSEEVSRYISNQSKF